MPDLPKERLLPDLPPFTNVGVDYFGPFEVKRGRSMCKCYNSQAELSTWKWRHLWILMRVSMPYGDSSAEEGRYPRYVLTMEPTLWEQSKS